MTANTDRILLVDDDDTQRKLVKRHLERAGFVVDAATGAGEALALARASHPDLIVSDVLMPDVDGFELCRRLKDDALLAPIPVVLISGLYSFRANRELAKRVGAAVLLERTPSFENELASVRLCMTKRNRNGADDLETTCEDHHQTEEIQLTELVDQVAEAGQHDEAQKLDALGQLTSGIAHDLNNTLAVILTNACLLIEDHDEGDSRRADAEVIKAAAERATALTHELGAAASAHTPGRKALRLIEDYPQIRRALSRSHHQPDDDVKTA